MKGKSWIIGVISMVISGLLNELIVAAVKKIPWGKAISVWSKQKFILPKGRLLSILFFLVLLPIVYYTIQWYIAKRKRSVIDAIKAVNVYTDDEKQVRVTWDVGFDVNQRPYIENIQCFCLLHGELPLKMLDGKCLDPNCRHSECGVDMMRITNYIESILLEKQRQLTVKR